MKRSMYRTDAATPGRPATASAADDARWSGTTSRSRTAAPLPHTNDPAHADRSGAQTVTPATGDAATRGGSGGGGATAGAARAAFHAPTDRRARNRGRGEGAPIPPTLSAACNPSVCPLPPPSSLKRPPVLCTGESRRRRARPRTCCRVDTGTRPRTPSAAAVMVATTSKGVDALYRRMLGQWLLLVRLYMARLRVRHPPPLLLPLLLPLTTLPSPPPSPP